MFFVARKSGYCTLPLLIDAAHQVRGDADIERTVALACHDGATRVFHAQSGSDCVAGGQRVQGERNLANLDIGPRKPDDVAGGMVWVFWQQPQMNALAT
jgi:hypothetical protein